MSNNNIDYQNTTCKLNAEAHDENNSHLNNIESCLSEYDYYTDSELNAMHGNIQSIVVYPLYQNIAEVFPKDLKILNVVSNL